VGGLGWLKRTCYSVTGSKRLADAGRTVGVGLDEMTKSFGGLAEKETKVTAL